MDNKLSIHDLDVILQSLEHTRHKFENYEYPSYEIKKQRLDEVNAVMAKVRELKSNLKLLE